MNLFFGKCNWYPHGLKDFAHSDVIFFFSFPLFLHTNGHIYMWSPAPAIGRCACTYTISRRKCFHVVMCWRSVKHLVVN